MSRAVTGIAAPQSPPPLARGDALFIDFDGTLVEIAAMPDRVEVMAGVPALLQRAAVRLGGALAVISGRPLAELGRFLAGYTGAAAGIHGLERRSASGETHVPTPDPVLDLVWPVVRQFAAVTQGVLIEDKRLSIAIHYRGRPELAEACRRLAEQAVILSKERLAMRPGKMVVELHPRDVDKGRAVRAFLAEPEFAGRRPVFVGDDRTDEDGFAFVNEHGGISVHVGTADDTFARYRLDGVDAVIRWLEDFLAEG
ncbi:MAG: trehalose-phosphatase [Alphaproteobacteria bacterium]|nr:trehalose-phosphatase [Alphaproteobacteria bacterium]